MLELNKIAQVFVQGKIKEKLVILFLFLKVQYPTLLQCTVNFSVLFLVNFAGINIALIISIESEASWLVEECINISIGYKILR